MSDWEDDPYLHRIKMNQLFDEGKFSIKPQPDLTPKKDETPLTMSSNCGDMFSPGDYIDCSGYENVNMRGRWVVSRVVANTIFIHRPWYHRLWISIRDLFKRVWSRCFH